MVGLRATSVKTGTKHERAFRSRGCISHAEEKLPAWRCAITPAPQ